MNKEFEVSYKFLEILGKCNEKFMALSNKLRHNYLVIDAKRELDCRFYEVFDSQSQEKRLCFEEFVEATLSNEIYICWSMEIYALQDEWKIECCILRTQDGVQNIIKKFPISPR